ncbi:MAG: TldE/PmbA family protein [Actinomycetia bacterium]|nr:TldE/PmbA family protein [Actinomycetes bacterium]MCP4963565.1 TldE/PmbA family protein [Actinomycetes bacterium]
MNNTPTKDRAGYVDKLIDDATQSLSRDEVLLVAIGGETSNFVRFNHTLVRQAGSVDQMHASIDLSSGQRHCSMTVGLSGELDSDTAVFASAIDRLREQREAVPDDPYFMYATEVSSTSQVNPGTIPGGDEIVDTIGGLAEGTDLVGIWAAGEQFSAFANSLGQRNWFSSTTFNLDWSLYLRADKATKQQYAGFDWSTEVFERKLAEQRAHLAILERDPVVLAPGDYRAFLSAAATNEIVSMLMWGGFGIRSHRTTDSPLVKMTSEGRTLSPMVTISEDTTNGVAPNFESKGFMRPATVPLITDGAFVQPLVSPRSSREYDVATNGANSDESPASVSMLGGDLDTSSVIGALDTGLLISNLWYLNFSDRPNCRMTGMTRFATFWVENGEVVAPVAPMRFDDSAYGLLGDRLVALTSEAELTLDPFSYGARSTESSRLPGALVNDMRFTL